MSIIKLELIKNSFSDYIFTNDQLILKKVFTSNIYKIQIKHKLNIQGKETFLENGGENFDLIPCLNDSSNHIKLFEKLVKKYL